MTDSLFCDCGETQIVRRIEESYPLRKYAEGVLRIHLRESAATEWSTKLNVRLWVIVFSFQNFSLFTFLYVFYLFIYHNFVTPTPYTNNILSSGDESTIEFFTSTKPRKQTQKLYTTDIPINFAVYILINSDNAC